MGPLYDRIPDLDTVFQCPFSAVHKLDGILGLTLVHEPPFQTQLFICEPNIEVPDHRHPDVDTLLVYLCGEMVLRVKGFSYRFTEESIKRNPKMRRGSHLHIGPDVAHGLSVGPTGGAFISVQKWLKGMVTSTDQNWQGPPIGPLHQERLK